MTRAISAMSIAAYLLATSAALFHGHDHDHPLTFEISASSSADHNHRHCGHSHAESHGHPHDDGHPHHHGHPHDHSHHGDHANHGHSHSHGSDHPDHDCAACQFLALSTVAVTLVTIDIQTEWMTLSEPEAILRPDAPALPLPFSRGPPRIAVA